MFLLPSNLYSPDDVAGTATVPLTSDGILDELNKDDGKTETETIDLEDKIDKRETKETKDDEETVEIEDDKEIKDEDLELVTPVRRKDVLAKYPNIFKDFPDLEKSYYREQKYSELLPTLEDAQNAVDRAGAFDELNEIYSSGSTAKILHQLKTSNEENFKQVVDNYLPDLYRVDQQAYLHVCGNVIKQTISEAVKAAQKHNREDLSTAALMLHEFVFGTDEYTPPTNLSRTSQRSSREQELEQREREYNERQFNDVTERISNKMDNVLRATIDKNIDPKDSMTPYVKRNAIKDAEEQLDELIQSDTRFIQMLDRLWEDAYKRNFNQQSLDRIESAYKSKAKTLLPEVIRKARNEALKGLGKKYDDGEERDRKGPLAVGSHRRSTTPSSSGNKDSLKDQARSIPKGMTSLDFLNQD